MANNNADFHVTFEGAVLLISEYCINDQRVFRAVFPDERKPLVLAVAISYNKKFWTSVPQGRQAEAEKIGRLIALYFKGRK